MKALILALMGIGFAFTHGLREGITMWQPNPREHLWYNLYHRIAAACLLSCALFFIWASRWCGNSITWLSTAGIALLGWQAAEIGYGIARHCKIFPDEENVMGTGFYIKGAPLGLLNGIRILGGISLILILGVLS